MSTTVNFKENGKTVSKEFGSNKEIVKYCESEIRKIELKEKNMAKYPRLCARLREEKQDYERIMAFYKKLDNKKMGYRDRMTGEYHEIEIR